MRFSTAAIACLLVGASAFADDPKPRPITVLSASASSIGFGTSAKAAIDGLVDNNSRWLSESSAGPHWLELDLGQAQRVSGLHVYSGYGEEAPVQTFAVQFWKDGRWHDVPSGRVENNQATRLALPFDETVELITGKLRLQITEAPGGVARVKEVVVWPAGPLPPLPPDVSAKPTTQASIPTIYLNQSGFNAGEPKRFTAPLASDGARFIIVPSTGEAPVFEGKLVGKVGDFSAFEPGDDREYVVQVGSERSVPFRVGMWWLERVTYQNAVNFMIDSRHYVGNYRKPCPGSFGWRDDHHFGWELHTLVPQYLSNPSAYERMPIQIQYEAPTDPKLWGALQPYRDDAPDIVRLIHWGADIIVTQKLDHELLKSQLAYFLYAWPALSRYLPEQNYTTVRDYAFATWDEDRIARTYPYDESKGHNLLAVKTKVGSTKGSLPPGFSVQPNLMMYEVARREKRPDANRYLLAAQRQTEWIIANLDWNDPLTTKGQRMSEFITMTGLAYFLSEFPQQAPTGLVAKVNEWAQVVIRRSDNLWDFRKLDDGDRWTPMGEKPTMWNEPGNVLGLPAAIFAALPHVQDERSRERLTQIAFAHFDNGFGRNPVGRHFSFDAPRDIEGVEHGWFSHLPGGIGQLSDARFVIDGAPKDKHYPYNPGIGNIGWTEGWIQFNTAFNASLAYLAHARTKLSVSIDGDALIVRLEAPLNFDYSKTETGSVMVMSSRGDSERVTVTETTPNSRVLEGRLPVARSAPPKAGDGTLQVNDVEQVEATYGFGYLGRRARLGR
jgi:hypothetical protein